MPGKGTRVANHTIRLDAPNLRLANLLAMRYGVTLQQLIEALVLGCAERDGVGGPGAATPVATPSIDTRRRGNVIDLSAVRERRRARAQRRANPVSLQTTDRRARAGAVVERSQHARAMAAAACEMAGQARLRAEEV